MNDFTKEELNMLADGIVLIKNKCKVSDDTLKKLDILDEKLCAMINNYCEHENDNRFNAMPMDGAPKMCKKCGGFWI